MSARSGLPRRAERIARAKKRAADYAKPGNTIESLAHAVECMDRLVKSHGERYFETEEVRYLWPARWERIKREAGLVVLLVLALSGCMPIAGAWAGGGSVALASRYQSTRRREAAHDMRLSYFRGKML